MYIDNIYKYSEEEIIIIFKKVIKNAKWNVIDKIDAVGDYGDICTYNKDKLIYSRISLR